MINVIFKTIKKATAIFLIILLGFNSFGLFFFYWGKIELCKIKARDYSDDFYQVKEKTFKLFSSASKEFQLINDHEILAGGNLYDIVKTETSNGKILYYTLSDEEEDIYVRQLTDLGKSNSQEQSIPAKTVGLHIEKYFEVRKHNHLIFITLLRVHESVKLSNDLFQYISPLEIVFSPPPELLLS